MLYHKYNIKQFKNAWFNEDFSEMDKDTFQQVYTEYIDKTGLYESEEFDKVSYIVFLNNRVNSVNVFLKLQKDFLQEFDLPCEHYFYFIEKFGHKIIWNGDKQNFLSQIEKIKSKENKYVSKIKNETKLLNDIRKKKNKNKELTEKDIVDNKIKSRESFIRTLNSLGKIGYIVDEEKTSVEQFSLMILQQKEELEEIQNR